ncbi:hypothetical protein TRVL_08735 [Trypanosoma vivax]|nr:hypothetical protein TRVL_08735 [Trypanosoma vivax]
MQSTVSLAIVVPSSQYSKLRNSPFVLEAETCTTPLHLIIGAAATLIALMALFISPTTASPLHRAETSDHHASVHFDFQLSHCIKLPLYTTQHLPGILHVVKCAIVLQLGSRATDVNEEPETLHKLRQFTPPPARKLHHLKPQTQQRRYTLSHLAC